MDHAYKTTLRRGRIVFLLLVNKNTIPPFPSWICTHNVSNDGVCSVAGWLFFVLHVKLKRTFLLLLDPGLFLGL